jgi:hypothetical protein
LTPPELLPLGGYTARQGRIAEAGGTPLYARTVDFRQKNLEIAVVSVEMLTVPESLRREVEKRIPGTVRLFLCATHTHCAPDSQMLNDRMTFAIPGIATFKPRWLTWYADRIAQGITQARQAQPEPKGGIGFLSWQTNTNRGRRKLAKPSQVFTELGEGDRPFLGHFAAHATFYDDTENKTRGDWPGALDVSGCAAMLVGAIGDVSPQAPGYDQAPSFVKIAHFWETVLSARPQVPFEPVGSWSGSAGSEKLNWISEPISLPPVKPSPAFITSYKTGEVLAKLLVTKFAPTSASISAWSVGKVAVIGVPGEPSSELGRQIEAAGKAQGWRKVLVVSHCNGWIGYILSPEDYDQGGYEATLNFYGREESVPIVKAAIHALARLKASSPSQKSR